MGESKLSVILNKGFMFHAVLGQIIVGEYSVYLKVIISSEPIQGNHDRGSEIVFPTWKKS